jgi:endonuclease/exonuclease/phosphatase family metal-dependent hydrolase
VHRGVRSPFGGDAGGAKGPGGERGVRRIKSFTAAICSTLLIAGLAASPAAAYRSMTWNIGGSPTSTAGRQFNLNDVQAVVSQYSPDIVALQEVCSWQAASLGQSLGYYWHETTIGRFNDGRTGSGGKCDYGNALLSKTGIPPDGRYRTDLLAPSEGCKYDAYQGSGYPECRLDMGALITPSGGSVVRSASAHVGTAGEPYTPPYDQSLELSRLVNDATSNAGETATTGTALMMGDYNVYPQDTRMAPKFAALGYTDAGGSVAGQTCATTPGCAYTYPSGGSYGAPASKLDYIYFRNLRLDAHQVPEPVVNGHEASDHRPIVADFSSLQIPPPVVTLTAPPNGSSQKSSAPRFTGTAGTASGSSAVTVKIYGGAGAAGTPVQTIGDVPVGSDGSWSAQAIAALADGVYSARAEQADARGQVGSSEANTFTVDTAAPRVTLTAPANGSSTKSSTPTFGGAAGTSSGDATSVTVKIYSGASATGTQIQTLSASVSNGSWSIVSPVLAADTYTARAEQADAAGNTGLSSANTFTIRRGAKTASPAPAPAISSAHVAPSRFRLGSALPRISRRTPVGATISFGLSEAARVTLAFARPHQPGRLVGGRCVAPSRRNRNARACTRSVPAGSLRVNGTAGPNRIRFQGRLSRRRSLRPGHYWTTITATDMVGNRSLPRTTSFTVLPAR